MNSQVFLALGSRAAAFVPRGWAEALADAAADRARPRMSGAQRAVCSNLETALGHTVHDDMSVRVTRSYARYYLEIMRLAHRDAVAAVGAVRLCDEAHLVSTLERGRGAVALGAHVGNWDVAGLALAQRFGAMHAYAEPLRPARVFEFYSRMRARHGVQVLCAGKAGRAPRRVLRNNGILGLMLDRTFGARSETVPFGVGRLPVPVAGLRLALRAAAGVHTVFACREADGYSVHVGPDLAGDLVDVDVREGVRVLARRFAHALQEIVARYPEQWCLLEPLPERENARPLPSAAQVRVAGASARGVA